MSFMCIRALSAPILPMRSGAFQNLSLLSLSAAVSLQFRYDCQSRGAGGKDLWSAFFFIDRNGAGAEAGILLGAASEDHGKG